MLHHAALELAAEDLERSIEMWRLIGFERVAEPAALSGEYVWLERCATQIHLVVSDSPTVPRRGHVAVVAERLRETIDELRAAGFAVADKRDLWGARRVAVMAPAGHLVELMQAPP